MMSALRKQWMLIVAATGYAMALAGCGGGSDQQTLNVLPQGIVNVVGPMTYDGNTNDLLTGGLGKTGIGSAVPPGFADPLNPSSAELRTRTIHTNYRNILDSSAAGGFGTLYGPNIDTSGNATLGEGKIAGKEYLAYADDASGKKNVVLMVQIPASFDAASPCIVAGPTSGTRGVYGAMGTVADWGLKHGCAVAYTDAGHGIGYHDLASDKVNLIDGRLVSRASAGTSAHFAADLTGAALTFFNAAFPNRIAYKHIYSQQNPEKDWGRNVLDSIRFAFWVLNEQYSPLASTGGQHVQTIVPGNTIVIVSSISAGGAASLQAAEQDSEGLIDGVAISEPSAQPSSMAGVTVSFNGAPVPNAGKQLSDYFSYRVLYELCAALSASAQAPNGVRPGWTGAGTAAGASSVAGVDLNTIATNRCQSLADKGLIAGATTAQQADAALAKMQAYGWTDPLNNALHASMYRLGGGLGFAFANVSAYGKFSASENICGFSLANFDASGNVAPQVPATQAAIFASSNGLNTGGDFIYNDSVGGAKIYYLGISPSTGRMDGSLDGQLCLRNMVTGVDTVTGVTLSGAALVNSQRVRAGMAEVLLTGNLHGKPTVIIQGRSDTLVPVNHSSRAYVAFNSKVEGAASNVRYYEITNAQHYDTFIPAVAGFDALFVPGDYYFISALDLMWARLKNGTALPASQVVRTTPRGGTPGSAPPITTANVPKIAATPAAANTISVASGTINVPQ